MKHAGVGPRRQPANPGGRCALDRPLPRPTLSAHPLSARGNHVERVTCQNERVVRTTVSGSKSVLSNSKRVLVGDVSGRTCGVTRGHWLVEAGVRRWAQEESARGRARGIHLYEMVGCIC